MHLQFFVSLSFHVPITLNPLQTNKCFGAPGTCQLLTQKLIKYGVCCGNSLMELNVQQHGLSYCHFSQQMGVAVLDLKELITLIKTFQLNGYAEEALQHLSSNLHMNLSRRKLFLCFSVKFALPLTTSGVFYGPHALLPPEGHILNLPLAKLSLSKSYLPRRDQVPSPGYQHGFWPLPALPHLIITASVFHTAFSMCS